MSLRECPRCGGGVMADFLDEDKCVNCGYAEEKRAPVLRPMVDDSPVVFDNPDERKGEGIRLLKDGILPHNVARLLGARLNTVYKWKKQIGEAGE